MPTWNFEVHWKSSHPYMPANLADMIGVVNKRKWRDFEADTLIIRKIYFDKDHAPIFVFSYRDSGWEVHGMMPFVRRSYLSRLAGLENCDEVTSRIRSGEVRNTPPLEEVYRRFDRQDDGAKQSGISDGERDGDIDRRNSRRGVPNYLSEQSLSGRSPIRYYTCRKCHLKTVRWESSVIHAWMCSNCGWIDESRKDNQCPTKP